MTPDMLIKANANKQKMGVRNVEFRQGQIEAMPVDSNSIDVVMSNCVINLSPDKRAVFGEAYRVLKSGRRRPHQRHRDRRQLQPQQTPRTSRSMGGVRYWRN